MSDVEQEIREFNIKELSRRNGETAQAALRELDNRISDLYGIIVAQQNGMVALQSRVQDIELAATMQRASNVGTGPTVEAPDGNND